VIGKTQGKYVPFLFFSLEKQLQGFEEDFEVQKEGAVFEII